MKKLIHIENNKSYAENMQNDGLNHVKQFDTKLMIEKQIDLYDSLIKNLYA